MSTASTDILQPANDGWYCPAGDFYIDPQEPVDRAVVTHAHSDHLRSGHASYVVSTPSVPLVRRRLRLDDEEGEVRGVDYGEAFEIDGATVSLHPAGHMLGAAQVRVAVDGEVWVVTGDYKRQPDPTCRPFEVVACDVFVTEATFALPIYRWEPGEVVGRRIWEWWEENRRAGRPSVLFSYAVGKAQRVLAHLDEWTDRRVLLHGAMVDFVVLYRQAGVAMPPTDYVTDLDPETDFAGELVVAPPSALSSSWMERFDGCRTGFASGWMRVRANKRRRGYDKGFVLSDHADWPRLLETIRQTGADRVLAEHGDTDALVRYLEEHEGLQAAGVERGDRR